MRDDEREDKRGKVKKGWKRWREGEMEGWRKKGMKNERILKNVGFVTSQNPQQ